MLLSLVASLIILPLLQALLLFLLMTVACRSLLVAVAATRGCASLQSLLLASLQSLLLASLQQFLLLLLLIGFKQSKVLLAPTASRSYSPWLLSKQHNQSFVPLATSNGLCYMSYMVHGYGLSYIGTTQQNICLKHRIWSNKHVRYAMDTIWIHDRSLRAAYYYM